MIRRDFLKRSSGLLLASQLPSIGLAQLVDSPFPTRREGISVVQGATDETSAQFSIVHRKTSQLLVEIVTPIQDRLVPLKLSTTTFPGAADAVTQLLITGLKTQTDYRLEIKDVVSGVIEERSFRTLDLSKPSLRVAICSCMDDTRYEPTIWTKLMAQNPDLIYFIGDSVYIDKHYDGTPDPAVIWQRHCEARRTLDIYYAKKLTPIFAVWDDHDFGMDNSDSRYPFAKDSAEIFQKFFPMDAGLCSLLTEGPGISRALQINDHNFLFLDDRTYRKPSGSKDRYAHWGSQQEQWMMETIRQERGPVWLINGTQFFSNNKIRESVASEHPEQYKGMVNNLREITNPLVFVSGDVHFSELSQLEPELFKRTSYEITSSSIHSRAFFGAFSPNPRRIEVAVERNFVMVDVKINGISKLESELNCVGSSRTYFRRSLSVNAL